MGNKFNYYQHLDVDDRVTLSINHNLELCIIRTKEGYVVDAYAPELGDDAVFTLGCIYDDDLEELEED